MLLKEGKKVFMSIAFLIFVVVMLVDFQTQYSSALQEPISEPQPDREEFEEYGYVYEQDRDLMMQAAVETLIQEFSSNSYSSYPFGFYKEVRLNEKKKAEMGEIVKKLTGYASAEIVQTTFKIPYYTLDEESGEMVKVVPDNGVDLPLASEHASYHEFSKLMEKAEELIGGGSAYSQENLKRAGSRPFNYEEAKAAYEEMQSSGYSLGYARLLCDYMCIFAGLFSAFVTIAVWLRDRSAKMRDIIWIRRVSSLRLTLSRYGAVVLLCSAVVYIIAGISLLGLMKLYPGEVSRGFEFFKYITIWVVPTIMASAAIGAFFTELTDTPIGILFMAGYWYLSLNMTSLYMSGLQWFTFMPRHNSEFQVEEFAANYSLLLSNRAMFTGGSIVLILVTAFILEMKRRGRWLRFDKVSLRRKEES